MFIIRGYTRLVCEDNYKEGCSIEHTIQEMPTVLTAPTIEALLDKFKAEFPTNEIELELDACAEMGRVDTQLTETADGYTPTKAEFKAWRKGHIKLYAVTCIAYVEEIKPVSIAKESVC